MIPNIETKFRTPMKGWHAAAWVDSSNPTQGGKVPKSQRLSALLTQIYIPYLSVNLIPSVIKHWNQLWREVLDSSFSDVFELENNCV